MKPSTAKKKGADTEILYVDYLKQNGVPNAERRHLNGVYDKGDIAGWNAHDGSWNVVVEVKSGGRASVTATTALARRTRRRQDTGRVEPPRCSEGTSRAGGDGDSSSIQAADPQGRNHPPRVPLRRSS